MPVAFSVPSQEVNFYMFHGATVTGYRLNREGYRQSLVEIQLQVPHPYHIQRKADAERRRPTAPAASGKDAHRVVREYWEATAALQPGSLVCLWIEAFPSTSNGPTSPPPFQLVFAVASTSAECDAELRRSGTRSILLRPCGTSADAVQATRTLLALAQPRPAGATITVLQSSTFLFEAVRPVLQALANTLPEQLPFADVLASPGVAGGQPPPTLSLPSFLQDGGRVDLRCIVPPAQANHPRVHELAAVNPADPLGFPDDALQAVAGLDASQVDALRAALTRQVVVIQGPPGTGKTFIGVQLAKVLLARAYAPAEAGRPVPPTRVGFPALPRGVPQLDGAPRHRTRFSILCVCYTNHALDQILMAFRASGIRRIVRIGAGTRDEALLPHNLSELRQKLAGSASGAGPHKKADGAIADEVDRLLTDLAASSSRRPLWEQLRRFLDEHAPAFSQYFDGMLDRRAADAEGFRAVLPKRDRKRDRIELWMQGRDPATRARGPHHRRSAAAAAAPTRVAGPLPVEQLLALAPAAVPVTDRPRLVAHWQAERTRRLNDRLADLLSHSAQHREAITTLYEDCDIAVLREASVIGLTTTGAAKNIDLLRKVGPSVLLVEEAGEVRPPTRR